jgi:pyruvate dehydrogenase E2 component (dihydrolipoamide acetyltransferase)
MPGEFKMAIEIIIPKVGEITTEVRILRWIKAEGETVKQGEPLLEIETDKATVEIESDVDGILERILVTDGEFAGAMQVVGMLSGEAEAGVVKSETEKSTIPTEARAIPKGARPASADISASPKAKQLARELDIDLTLVKGTGVGGNITTSDVRTAASDRAMPLDADDIKELSRMRRAIATHMLVSKRTIPHFYLMTDVIMAQAQQLRKRCVEDLGWERSPTYTDIIVKACALAVVSMPEVNVHYHEDGLIERSTVDIGVAVSLDDGLIVPMVSNVDRIGLRKVSEAIRDLARRARKGRLKASDLAERSIAVTNLGMEGVDAFVAIINPPDPMTLAVGRVADRVIPIEGKITIQPMCTLTLSIDHRVLDGVLGSRFLMCVKEHLENPVEILGE